MDGQVNSDWLDRQVAEQCDMVLICDATITIKVFCDLQKTVCKKSFIHIVFIVHEVLHKLVSNFSRKLYDCHFLKYTLNYEFC